MTAFAARPDISTPALRQPHPCHPWSATSPRSLCLSGLDVPCPREAASCAPLPALPVGVSGVGVGGGLTRPRQVGHRGAVAQGEQSGRPGRLDARSPRGAPPPCAAHVWPGARREPAHHTSVRVGRLVPSESLSALPFASTMGSGAGSRPRRRPPEQPMGDLSHALRASSGSTRGDLSRSIQRGPGRPA